MLASVVPDTKTKVTSEADSAAISAPCASQAVDPSPTFARRRICARGVEFEANEECVPERMNSRQFLRERRLEAEDESFGGIDPAMRARLKSFIRFAFPYNRQSNEKKSALDLIGAYNDQLPANETPAEMMFFQKKPCNKTDA
jgi:hypothetical protein